MIPAIKTTVRRYMHSFAQLLDKITKSKLTPNTVTLIGLFAHIPIAYLIATNSYILAAILLIIFGLFDTLDGELARLQHRSSDKGMLLDATTDRMKEVFLYTGAAYSLVFSAHPATAVLAVVALGASLCVSYVKAKGEAAVAARSKKIEHHVLNRMFADGFLTFEVRMVVLILGLLTGYLAIALAFIAVFASYTAVVRLVRISHALS